MSQLDFKIVTATNEVNNTFQIGDHPVRGLVSPDNALLYVANFGSDSVAVYSIDNGKRTASVPVGSHPESMALTPGRRAAAGAGTRGRAMWPWCADR